MTGRGRRSADAPGGRAGRRDGYDAETERVAFECLPAIYDDLDRKIDAVLAAFAGSACRECGTCCVFPEGSPVLNATALEHAYLASVPPPIQVGMPESACPYFEIETGYCTARERRTVVCRTYFCDDAMRERAAREAVQELYYQAQAEIARIMDAHGIDGEHRPV